MRRLLPFAVMMLGLTVACTDPHAAERAAALADSLRRDSLHRDSVARYSYLTKADYDTVARQLGIESATVRAVLDVEVGTRHSGFAEPGVPVVTFDAGLFRQFAAERGIRAEAYRDSLPLAFVSPKVSEYPSLNAARMARVRQAMAIDTVAAIQATFWGMFQIGGFNWELCGADSPQDFMDRMCYSELSQLELFAAFLRSRNLVRFLRAHRWEEFSMRYNGFGFGRRSYDEALAAAYYKYARKSPPLPVAEKPTDSTKYMQTHVNKDSIKTDSVR